MMISPAAVPSRSSNSVRRRIALAAFALLGMMHPSVHAAETSERGAAAADQIAVSDADWPWWRGPFRNGVAAENQRLPLAWSDEENVLWRAEVPGRGHGSPTVVGDQVFLATADVAKGTQSVLCFDRRTGKRLWLVDVHTGGLETKGHARSSQASSSVACDGERLFINFVNGGAVYTTALDRSGKQLWQTRVSDYVMHQGFGSSPAVYGPLVLVSADHKGGGVIAALQRTTGEIVWKQDRPEAPNYTSPIVLSVAGRPQLLMIGCDLVSSFDPLTGEKLWETAGATTECVTSTVTDGVRIFTSGGYPKNHISAILADGSGQAAWRNNVRVYVPSLLVKDGYLYGVTDAGVACCWKCDTGEEVWKGRLGGDFSGSPVLAGDHVYATNEAGRTFIFRADPAGFELIAENPLGDEAFASPTLCGGRLYLRVAKRQKGTRQEFLYCIGDSEP